MLAERANGRFIFAATVIRLIDQDQPQDRLPLVCGMLRGDVSRVWGDIDHLYASAINDIDASVRTVGLQYLSLIVNLAEPLSSSNLRFLFGTDIHPYLLPFSAFVSIPPSSSSNVVQIYHTSLRDFLQKCDPQSGHQQLADAETHQRLVTSCFRMMARVLRRDVCGLKDPSLLHDEIPDYTQKRDAIPRALLYTCRHWLYHLQRTGAPPDNATQGLLLDFLEKRVVFAIEVYSIFGELAVGVRLLRAARKFVRTWPTSAIKDTALPLLYDCWRLTLDFFYPISFSALHVYESALPCSPARSKIRSAYMHIIDRPTTLVFEHGLDEEWDCVTRIIETEFSDLLLSPDGAQLVTRAPLEIHVWDTATGQLVTSLSQNIPVPSTTHSFAYNGSHVALCGVRSFYLWNLSTGGCVELFPEPLHLIHGRVRHTSGFMIGASATRDGTPVYHSAQLLATGPLCFSFDGSSIACVAAKPPQAENANTKRCSIYIYDVNTGKLRSQIPFEFEAVRTSLEFAADNNHLLVHNVGFVGIVDVMNGQLLGSLGCCNTQSGWRRTLFSLDNRQIFHLADQGRADIEKYSFGQTTRTVSYQLATQNSATQLHIRGPPPTGSRSLMLQKIEDTSQSEQSLLGANPQPIEYAAHQQDPGSRSVSAKRPASDQYPNIDLRFRATMPALVSDLGDLMALKTESNTYVVIRTSGMYESFCCEVNLDACGIALRHILRFTPQSTYIAIADTTADGTRIQLWDPSRRSGYSIESVLLPSTAPGLLDMRFCKEETAVALSFLSESQWKIAVFSQEGSKLEHVTLFSPGALTDDLAALISITSVTPNTVHLWRSNADGTQVNHLEWRRATSTVTTRATFPYPCDTAGKRLWLVKVAHSPSFNHVHFMSLDVHHRVLTTTFTMKTPLPDHERDNNREDSYKVKLHEDQDSFSDMLSWSDLRMDTDGWLRQRRRRICWLPERYRPKDLEKAGLRLVVDGSRVTIPCTNERKSVTLRFCNTEIHYFD
ncbi:hypothetical protein CONPUDRAFT_144677 [Coniophora puteana RWD-64-598 SS2]|uniref:WD40 repeat-like protein n=1 Tax=Coniophora puteana (strain RWD-64-598) TaxID=741705 RepID=A0A5M3MNX3_CONPW|nr:uncharacterized protein CONPUDRAFT_144677 [Coniophora puteana RWD-64-598 SS2]EIW80710.1 hypothetical protein CONPUDRAFT_144677 [Coniophora puteana RWD-64-598 SS2]